MLAKWTEILPLFIVRYIAKRHCEVVQYHAGSTYRSFAVARPDVLIKL